MEDPAGEINVTVHAILMQEPGTKAYPISGFLSGSTALMRTVRVSIERDRDRRGRSTAGAAPLRAAIFVDPAELGVVEPCAYFRRSTIRSWRRPGCGVWQSRLAGPGVAHDRNDPAGRTDALGTEPCGESVTVTITSRPALRTIRAGASASCFWSSPYS